MISPTTSAMISISATPHPYPTHTYPPPPPVPARIALTCRRLFWIASRRIRLALSALFSFLVGATAIDDRRTRISPPDALPTVAPTRPWSSSVFPRPPPLAAGCVPVAAPTSLSGLGAGLAGAGVVGGVAGVRSDAAAAADVAAAAVVDVTVSAVGLGAVEAAAEGCDPMGGSGAPVEGADGV